MSFRFRPDRPRWVQVAEVIRDRIEAGDYGPGEAIPSEPALVREFGIARTTARKATAWLREEGLIYTVPNLGSFVRARD